MTSISFEASPKTGPAGKLSWPSVIFFGAFHALVLLAPFCFSWSALGVAIALHWLTGSIGICLAYHRLLSHRSFKVPKWLEYVLTTIAALAMEGGPIFWVAGHRLHHSHTEDVVHDPYSAKRGFWWSHMQWMLYPREEHFDYHSYKKYAPDLAKDGYYRWLDRYFWTLQLPVAMILYALGGWSFVLYGVAVRVVALWHCTWLINSATHAFGYRTFDDADDDSRNLWWAAILAYGEGWHNNHHAYPSLAKAGLKWWEIDMTWWAIQVLRAMGLAKKVILPSKKVLDQL